MKKTKTGKLKIGNNWNAITIIAFSQNNPLKAIAEFVENSIDARAKNITIIRGKHKGNTYLKVVDDGEGIDDFDYVATHIGDSIKRKLKKKGIAGIQGEFGIGLLSFWTVGEELTMISTGKTGLTQRLTMVKNNQGYKTTEVHSLFPQTGTELTISPLLPGIKQLSGEKIQNYLASELRDRIHKTGVRIKILDRTRRKDFIVEPRQFTGRLLHGLPSIKSPLGEIYFELYLSEPSPDNTIGIYKSGTRVISSITTIDQFNGAPWNSPYLEGILDISFLHLTPGTRDGIIYDDAFENFVLSVEPLGFSLSEIIEEQKRAEEDKASRNILHKITKALHEAFRYLPQDEYSWLEVKKSKKISVVKKEALLTGEDGEGPVDPVYVAEESDQDSPGRQKNFFEIPGPLFSAVILPSALVMGVGSEKKLKVVARDKSRRQLDSGYSVIWFIEEGSGEIDNPDSEFITFKAPAEPGIIILKVMVKQDEKECTGECIITVTDELVNPGRDSKNAENAGLHKGLPGYTFQNAPGELWRSRYDSQRSIIIINNGHADFIYASKSKIRKLKYITKLFTKELVLVNFPEATKEELLERAVELQMYTEENLR